MNNKITLLLEQIAAATTVKYPDTPDDVLLFKLPWNTGIEAAKTLILWKKSLDK